LRSGVYFKALAAVQQKCRVSTSNYPVVPGAHRGGGGAATFASSGGPNPSSTDPRSVRPPVARLLVAAAGAWHRWTGRRGKSGRAAARCL